MTASKSFDGARIGPVLVTGATGLLGRNLCEELAARGVDVVALARNKALGAELEGPHMRFVACDLAMASVDDIVDILQHHKVSAVVHSAALASDWGEPAAFEAANVEATRHLLKAMRLMGVGRLVHISTPSVYLDGMDREMIIETDPLPRPINDYARTKGQAERLVRGFVKSANEDDPFAAVILRPRAIFGPYDRAILPRLLALGAGGKRVPLIGGGYSQLDFTYVGNVVSAIIAALGMPAEDARGQAYNITNGEPMAVRVFLEMAYQAFGKPLNVITVPHWLAMGLASWQERYSRTFTGGETPPRLTKVAVTMMGRTQTLNIDAAKRDLDWTPTISVAEGLKRTADWAAQNPDWP